MESLTSQQVLGLAPLAFIVAFILAFYTFSPASKSAKAWTTLYLTILAFYIISPETSKGVIFAVRSYIAEKPIKAGLIALGIATPLKYIQRKLRFARINAIRMKYGYTDDPTSWEDMTVEQAQEIESNMAEVRIHSTLFEASALHFVHKTLPFVRETYVQFR